ncbi:cg30-1 [Dikerogammarus haemobaphes nudivirus]|nr:cg30-1 [Dikerogammarus haemobaphes nudivirus]
MSVIINIIKIIFSNIRLLVYSPQNGDMGITTTPRISRTLNNALRKLRYPNQTVGDLITQINRPRRVRDAALTAINRIVGQVESEEQEGIPVDDESQELPDIPEPASLPSQHVHPVVVLRPLPSTSQEQVAGPSTSAQNTGAAGVNYVSKIMRKRDRSSKLTYSPLKKMTKVMKTMTDVIETLESDANGSSNLGNIVTQWKQLIAVTDAEHQKLIAERKLQKQIAASAKIYRESAEITEYLNLVHNQKIDVNYTPNDCAVPLMKTQFNLTSKYFEDYNNYHYAVTQAEKLGDALVQKLFDDRVPFGILRQNTGHGMRTRCCICMDYFTAEGFVLNSECSHPMCIGCFNRSPPETKMECPYCRTPRTTVAMFNQTEEMISQHIIDLNA